MRQIAGNEDVPHRGLLHACKRQARVSNASAGIPCHAGNLVVTCATLFRISEWHSELVNSRI
jgi:hypothetical protein